MCCNTRGKMGIRTSAPLTCLLFGRGGGSYVAVCVHAGLPTWLLFTVIHFSVTFSSKILRFSCRHTVIPPYAVFFSLISSRQPVITADCALHFTSRPCHITVCHYRCNNVLLCRVATLFLVFVSMHGLSGAAAYIVIYLPPTRHGVV